MIKPIHLVDSGQFRPYAVLPDPYGPVTYREVSKEELSAVAAAFRKSIGDMARVAGICPPTKPNNGCVV